MCRYYRNFVFTALLIVMSVPVISGTAGADLVELPFDNIDNAGNTDTVKGVSQTKSVGTAENAGTSVGTSENTTTTPAKKKFLLIDLVLKPASYLSYVMPASLQGKLAPLAGPKTAAHMSSLVSPEQAVKVAKHMDLEFMAECIYYLDPADATPILEVAPNDILIGLAEYLIKKKEYARMALFADQMTLKRATELFSQFNDADVMLNVAYHMKNTELLANSVAVLPQEYVNQLLYDVARLGASDPRAFKLMAHLSQRLPIDRILQMMETVAPSDVAVLVLHYPSELIVRLMDRFDEYQLTLVIEKMSSKMTPDEIGQLFNLSKPENKVLQQFAETVFNTMTVDQIMQLMDATGPAHLGAVSLRCPPEMVEKVLKKMDGEQTKECATKIGERITPVQIAMLMEMARPEYIAAVAPLCSPELIDVILAKADPDHLAGMALRFPPELGIRTLQEMDDAQARSLAAPISRIWAVRQTPLSGADATYVAMILVNSPPEAVGVIKPKLNKGQLQALIKIAARKVESGDPMAMKIFSQLVR